MATNLLFARSDIALNAEDATTFPDMDLEPLIRGYAHEGVWQPALTDRFAIRYDLDMYDPQITGIVDYVILGGVLEWAAYSDSGVAEVDVQGSDDDFNTSNESLTFTYDVNDLIGNLKRDVLLKPNFSKDYRYWRVEIRADKPIQAYIRSIYLGRMFDIGRNPRVDARVDFEDNNFNFYDRRRITLQYRGIKSKQKSFFENYFLRFADINPVYLYDQNNAILDGDSLSLFKIEDYSINWDQRRRDTYQIRLELQEL